VADPKSIDFGVVELDQTVEATIALTNLGQTDCTDVTALARPLTGPFALCSADAFSLPAGATENVCVDFTPTESIAYQGRVEFTFPDVPLTLNVPLSGEGTPVLAEMTIQSFRATGRVRLATGRPVGLRISVRNVGDIEGIGNLTVTGVQNGNDVYLQELPVSDPVGGGPRTYVLQSYFPMEAGDIEWTATLESALGTETATDTTVVVE
jgi:hypothetical protein